MARVAFRFNGVDQYATIPPWKPLGYDFDVAVDAYVEVDTGANQDILGTSDTGDFAVRISAADEWRLTYKDAGDVQRNSNRPVGGYPARAAMLAKQTGEGSTWTVNGSTANNVNLWNIPLTGAIDKFAATHVPPGNFFNGPIWDVKFIDNAPLQDRAVLDGQDAPARQIGVPKFIIPDGHDFNITFDYVRVDKGAAGTTFLFGDAANTYRVQIHAATDATNPDRITIVRGGAFTNFANAAEDVAQGQHCSIELRQRVGVGIELFVDGVSKGIGGAASTDGFELSTIYGVDFGYVAAGGAIGNLVLENLTNGEYIEYRIDEGAGTTVTGYDRNGLAVTTGTITPDAAWTEIPKNDRWYPMNEQAGTTLKCYDPDTGERLEALDGTLTSDAGWDILPDGGFGSGPGIALPDARFTYMRNRGFTGTNADMSYEFFQTYGYPTWRSLYEQNGGTGQLNDWLLEFFLADAAPPPYTPPTPVGSFSDEVLALSPFVYYKMDEASGNLVDAAGNANTSGIVGTPTYQQADIINEAGAIQFVPNEGFTSVPLGWVADGNISLVFALRANWPAASGAVCHIGDFANSSNRGITFQVFNTGQLYYIGWAGAFVDYTTTYTIPNDGSNILVGIAIEPGATRAEFYVNGVSVENNPSASVFNNFLNGPGVQLMCQKGASLEAFLGGTTGHIAVFNKALTSAEMATLATAAGV